MTISRLIASAVVAVCVVGSALAQVEPSHWRVNTGVAGLAVEREIPNEHISFWIPHAPFNSERSHFGDINLDPGIGNEDNLFARNAEIYGGFVSGPDRLTGKGPPLGASLDFGAGYVQFAYDADRLFEGGNSVVIQQGFAGVGYALSPSLGVQLRGRYLGASGAEFGDDQSFAKSQFKSFGATIGFVWRK